MSGIAHHAPILPAKDKNASNLLLKLKKSFALLGARFFTDVGITSPLNYYDEEF